MEPLRWYEPADFLRAWRERLYGPPDRRRQFLFFLAVAGVVLVVLLTSHLAAYFAQGRVEPVIPYWGWFLLAAGLGGLLGYVVPYLTSLGSGEVRVTERGIARKTLVGVGTQVETWLWEQIAHCAVEDMDLAGRRFRVLVLYAPDGGAYPLGLDARVPVESIRAALRPYGKDLVVRVPESGESP